MAYDGDNDPPTVPCLIQHTLEKEGRGRGIADIMSGMAVLKKRKDGDKASEDGSKPNGEGGLRKRRDLVRS